MIFNAKSITIPQGSVVKITDPNGAVLWQKEQQPTSVRLSIIIQGDTNGEFEAYGMGEYPTGTVVEYGVTETENRVKTGSSISTLTFFDHFDTGVYATKGTIKLDRDTTIVGYVLPLSQAKQISISQTGTKLTTNYYSFDEPTKGGAIGIYLGGRKTAASGTVYPLYDMSTVRVLHNRVQTINPTFYYRTNATFSNTMFVEKQITSVSIKGIDRFDIQRLPYNSTINYTTLTGSGNGTYRITGNCIIDADGKVIWGRSATIDTDADGVTAFATNAFQYNKTATLSVRSSNVVFEDTFAPYGKIYRINIYGYADPKATAKTFNNIFEGGTLYILSGRQNTDWYKTTIWKTELIDRHNWLLCAQL